MRSHLNPGVFTLRVHGRNVFTILGLALGVCVASTIAHAQDSTTVPAQSPSVPSEQAQTPPAQSSTPPPSSPAQSSPTPQSTDNTSNASAPPPAASKTGIPAIVLGVDEAEGILGKPVRSKNGEDAGRIIDVIVDRSAQVRGAVLEIGGFVGVGSRQVAVSWSALHRAAPADPSQAKTAGKLDPLIVDFTRDQLSGAPAYKAGEQTVLLSPADKASTMVQETPLSTTTSAPAAANPGAPTTGASAPGPDAPAPDTPAK